MDSPIILVIIILGIVAVLIVGALLFVRQIALKRTESVRERFPNALIMSANFYGQESAGVMQLRGNGTLALTGSELYFEQWVTQREYRIPLAAIQTIETPSSYLGKSNFRPLVKVVFRSESGGTDSMAWLVQDIEGLKRAIEAARA